MRWSLVRADLFGTELIEGLVEVSGEAFDVVGVGVDGPLREVADTAYRLPCVGRWGTACVSDTGSSGSLLGQRGETRARSGSRRAQIPACLLRPELARPDNRNDRYDRPRESNPVLPVQTATAGASLQRHTADVPGSVVRGVSRGRRSSRRPPARSQPALRPLRSGRGGGGESRENSPPRESRKTSPDTTANGQRNPRTRPAQKTAATADRHRAGAPPAKRLSSTFRITKEQTQR